MYMYPEKCGKPNAAICRAQVQIPSTIPDSNGVKKGPREKAENVKRGLEVPVRDLGRN